MEKFQTFNERSSVYHVVYDFIRKNYSDFDGFKIANLSKKYIKRLIDKEGVNINGALIKSSTCKIAHLDSVAWPSKGIEFICQYDDKYVEDGNSTSNILVDEIPKIPEIASTKQDSIPQESKSSVNVVDEIDQLIHNYLVETIGDSDLEKINIDKIPFAVSRITDLLKKFGYQKLRLSTYFFPIKEFLESVIITTKIPRELQLTKNFKSNSQTFLETLLHAKIDKERKLNQFIEDLGNGLYDKALFDFLKDYNNLVTSDSFHYLVGAGFNSNVSSKVAIGNLIRPVNQSLDIKNAEEKLIFYQEQKETYTAYFKLLDTCNTETKLIFHQIANSLLTKLKINCQAIIEKAAAFKVESTSKRYNFSDSGSKEHDIFLLVRNIGEGLASRVTINPVSKNYQFENYTLGILKPKEVREITLATTVHIDDLNPNKMEVVLEWENSSGQKESQEFNVDLLMQDKDIPWNDLINKQNPYTIQEIQDINRLFGRDDILNELKNNINSSNIQNYKIWGQKRVGKSSVVKTLKSLYDEQEKTIIVYRRIGSLRNVDPQKTLNNLGKALATEAINQIDLKIRSGVLREQLRKIPIPSFDGDLSPLEDYIRTIHNIDNALKFVFIIDEFDRINDIFFRPGDYCEVLSQAIGKGMNLEPHVGFILVGSENMQLLDRQGMNYNSYRPKKIDTFNKETQFIFFKKLVTEPVKEFFLYSDDSLEMIYGATEGNPYFTNLICQEIYNKACNDRDVSIDSHFTEKVINYIASTYKEKEHFEHFWGDGLTQDTDIKKEAKTDVRRRLLISFGMQFKSNNCAYPSKNEIMRSFKVPDDKEFKIERYEIENTLREFEVRGIFYETNGSYRIKPMLFEKWLCGPGKSLMIVGISDLEQFHREKEIELENAIKDEELKRLSDKLIFKGSKLRIEDFRNFFNQFDNVFEKRRIFRLVDSMTYISKEEISDFFRSSQAKIFKDREINLTFSVSGSNRHVRTLYREGVELFSFERSYQENEEIIDSFKKISRIRTLKKTNIVNEDNETIRKNEAEEVVILEPVIDDWNYVVGELSSLITPEFTASNIKVRLVCLVITTSAKTELIKYASDNPSLGLIFYKEIEDNKLKPFVTGFELYEKDDESFQVYNDVLTFFPEADKNSILLLFESFCPSVSCPIFWNKKGRFSPLFYNSFGKIHTRSVNDLEREGELRRERVYHANTELSQKLNKYLVNFLKQKAITYSKDDWFIREYIPKTVMETVMQKWISEGTVLPKESYFEFSDYRRIIETHPELLTTFNLPGDGLSWCDKLNILRRDPAHPEKPAPTEDEVKYFEKIKNQIINKLV